MQPKVVAEPQHQPPRTTRRRAAAAATAAGRHRLGHDQGTLKRPAEAAADTHVAKQNTYHRSS
eukprot:354458-Chlamydomonas_euryale.AAC.2